MNVIKPPLKKKTPPSEIVPLVDPAIKRLFYPNESKRPSRDIERLLKAYEDKNLDEVISILSSGLSVNYREPARAHRTPLLFAAKFNFIEAVDELLNRKADPLLADDSGITPLHAAASHGSLEPLKRLLEIGVDPNLRDNFGKTPLHFATQALGEDKEYNACNIVHALLSAGANVTEKDSDGRTPLHGASFSGNTEVISLLLSAKGSSLIYERDKDGRTPLHQAVLGARSLVAVKVLLHYNPPIDAEDNDGRTPLHYVAGRPINYVDKEFDGDCLELLLSFGASVHSKDHDGYNALSLALQRTMWWSRQSPKDVVLHAVQLLVSKGSAIVDGFDMWRIVETFPSLVLVALNQSIRTNTSAKDSPHLKLVLDFRPLTVNTRVLAERRRKHLTPVAPNDDLPIPSPLLNNNEISMLHYILLAGHKNILRHPLCSAFLHFKWLKVRKFFVVHVILYVLFLLTLTAFILTFQNDNEINNEILNATVNNSVDNTHTKPIIFFHNYIDFQGVLWAFTIFLVAKELFQIGHSPSIYLRTYDNYLDVLIMVCVLLLLLRIDKDFLMWHRSLSATAVIASWFRMMLILGQFPSFGVYIVMFSTVSKTVFKFLGMYIPLLIAFSLGFLILLNNISSFQGIPTSFVTTLIMMTGEIEYDEKFLNSKIPSRVFPSLILIMFLLLIYIILSNLLVALAVNDLHTIEQRSELLRLSSQVKLMVTVESFLKSPCVPTFLRKYLQKQFSITNSHSPGLVFIFPNKKHGYIDRLFLKLYFIFRCRRFLTKLFEYFDVDFIPPDVEPSLPKNLLREAINVALTELEIEKRDKLLVSKSYHTASAKQREIIKKQRNTHILPNVLISPEFQDKNIQENMRYLVPGHEETELDPLLTSSHPAGNHHRSPSMNASIWRANVQREAFRNYKWANSTKENHSLSVEIEQLRKTVSALQSSVDILTSKLNRPIQGNNINNHHIRPKLPLSSQVKSFPCSSQPVTENEKTKSVSF